jgi:glycosyltransferase involved in cell wall biosynthesis
VHIHALWDPFLHQIARWAKMKSIPLVYSPHGMLTPWALGQKSLKKWIALALYQYWDLRCASLIHATAESEVDDIRRLGLKQAVVVAPLGVSIPSEEPPIRHNNPKIALFVSRIHPKKGLFNLVDAWAKVKRSALVERSEVKDQRSDEASLTTNELMNSRTNELLPWKFIIAGPDQDGHAAEVMVRARAAGVEDDFEMIGPVYGKEKDELYARADLFVLPTYSENFGVVIIEALAFGCPVITTKGAPWAELETGHCGWWIDIGVEPLAQALGNATALTDAERYQMGLNGRALVEKRYTWPAAAMQMKSAYEWLLHGGEKSDCVQIT